MEPPAAGNSSSALQPERAISVRHIAAALAISVLAVFVAYLPALHGQYLWDDDFHVTKPELRSVEGLPRIWIEPGATEQYYPLLHSAFWLEYRLWGDNPLAYHLLNLFEHAAAVALVYFILRKLRVPGAWLAAAIFALHPVHVESVAWITQQKNTLSAVLYLSAMLVYLHFAESRKPVLYAAALALFVLALLSKTTTVTLPAAILVIAWWQRGRLSWQRDVRPLAPFFALALLAGLFTAWMEINVLHAVGTGFQRSLMERCLLASRAIWFYLGKLIFPTNLIFMYPRWEISSAAWWQWLYLMAFVAACAILWRMRGWSRAPLAAWLFFVGSLFPLLGFFNGFLFIYTYVADHFQYLPSLGIFTLVAAAITLAIARIPRDVQWIGNAACGLLLMTLGVLTWRQSEMYANPVTLYRTTLARNPSSWLVWNNLGKMYFQQNQLPESEEYYRQALVLNPDYHLAHFNLGVTLKAEGRYPEAIDEFQQAIKIKPTFAEAYFVWGVTLVSAGRLPEAIEKYEKALALKPNYAEAHSNIAFPLLQTGRTQEAIDHLEKALQLRPDIAEVHTNLAMVLAGSGRLQEAIEHYRQAIKLKPKYTDAYVRLAVALADAKRTDEAITTAVDALNLAHAQGQSQLAAQIEGLLRALRGNQ